MLQPHLRPFWWWAHLLWGWLRLWQLTPPSPRMLLMWGHAGPALAINCTDLVLVYEHGAPAAVFQRDLGVWVFGHAAPTHAAARSTISWGYACPQEGTSSSDQYVSPAQSATDEAAPTVITELALGRCWNQTCGTSFRDQCPSPARSEHSRLPLHPSRGVRRDFG